MIAANSKMETSEYLCDSRGVRRGCCMAKDCSCEGYDGGNEMKKCHKCAHPPGKHANMDSPAVASHNPAAAAGGSTPSHAMGADGSPYGVGSHSPPYQHQRVVLQLPPCQAEGCTKLVHFEAGLRGDMCGFAYCSPECRDSHLLPIYQAELKRELVEMKEELHKVAVADVTRSSPNLMRQSSNEQPPATITSASPPSATPKTGGSRKQKSAVVIIKKKAHKQSGLLLSKTPKFSDTGEVTGFIIIGVVADSAVYGYVQNDKLRLLDVIESINDTPCSKIFAPDQDVQERFERYIESMDSVRLSVDRTFSLQPISSPLAYAKRKSVKYSCVVVLNYSPESNDDHFGLTLSSDGQKDNVIIVKGVSKESPADCSRVKYSDKMQMYAVASQDEVNRSQLVSEKSLAGVLMDLEKANAGQRNVILFVKREMTYY